MLTFFRKNRIHVIIWAGMLLYLVFAHDLYVHFFLRNGKPIIINAELPAETDQINANIELFKPTIYNGQFYYVLTGWAFSTTDPAMHPEDYERQVVLISDEMNYYFPIETYSRPDVQKYFQSLGMELTNAGFHCQIYQDVIRPGTYQVGIVFYNHENESTYYAKTDKYLIRTPNQFQISSSATTP